MTKQFTCDNCHETFDSTWTDEEAKAERDELWTKEELAGGESQVCDDCFKEFMKWKNK